MRRVIQFSDITDRNKFDQLIVNMGARAHRLVSDANPTEQQKQFMKKLFSNDFGDLNNTQLKILFEKLPRSCISIDIDGGNALIWLIAQGHTDFLKVFLGIVEALPHCPIASGRKAAAFWERAHAGCTDSPVFRMQQAEMVLLKQGLRFAMRKNDASAIEILLFSNGKLSSDLRQYALPLAVEHNGGMYYAKEWKDLAFDVEEMAIVLSVQPDLIDELLLPKNFAIAQNIFTQALVSSRQLNHTFSPKQARAISLMSEQAYEYIVDHKISKWSVFWDALYYWDFSLMWRCLIRKLPSAPVKAESIAVKQAMTLPTSSISTARRAHESCVHDHK